MTAENGPPPQHTDERGPAGTASPFDPRDAAALIARGLAMGAADVVPGVSGGTIAFITGIYERFIEALRSISLAPLLALARGKPREALRATLAIHWGMLLPLGFGIVTAIVAFSGFILAMMETTPGPTYALFFGLIAASAWMPFARMRQRGVRHIIAGLIAAVGAFAFVGLRSDGVELHVVERDPAPVAAVYPGTIRSIADVTGAIALIESDRTPDGAPMPIVLLDRKGVLAGPLPEGVPPDRIILFDSREALAGWYHSADDQRPPPLIVLAERRASLAWIFICGSLAISAMVLPGVSGSFLLLFLGQYHAVFGALHGVIAHARAIIRGASADPLSALAGSSLSADLAFLAAFLLGVLIGIAAFARVVSWLLRGAHDLTMAALTGLMIGALRVPGHEVARAINAGGSWLWIILAAAVGAALVLALAIAERFMRSGHDARR